MRNWTLILNQYACLLFLLCTVQLWNLRLVGTNLYSYSSILSKNPTIPVYQIENMEHKCWLESTGLCLFPTTLRLLETPDPQKLKLLKIKRHPKCKVGHQIYYRVFDQLTPILFLEGRENLRFLTLEVSGSLSALRDSPTLLNWKCNYLHWWWF